MKYSYRMGIFLFILLIILQNASQSVFCNSNHSQNLQAIFIMAVFKVSYKNKRERERTGEFFITLRNYCVLKFSKKEKFFKSPGALFLFSIRRPRHLSVMFCTHQNVGVCFLLCITIWIGYRWGHSLN